MWELGAARTCKNFLKSTSNERAEISLWSAASWECLLLIFSHSPQVEKVCPGSTMVQLLWTWPGPLLHSLPLLSLGAGDNPEEGSRSTQVQVVHSCGGWHHKVIVFFHKGLHFNGPLSTTSVYPSCISIESHYYTSFIFSGDVSFLCFLNSSFIFTLAAREKEREIHVTNT
jgi:hypothetical protein